jgi:hypothetical protein
MYTLSRVSRLKKKATYGTSLSQHDFAVCACLHFCFHHSYWTLVGWNVRVKTENTRSIALPCCTFWSHSTATRILLLLLSTTVLPRTTAPKKRTLECTKRHSNTVHHTVLENSHTTYSTTRRHQTSERAREVSWFFRFAKHDSVAQSSFPAVFRESSGSPSKNKGSSTRTHLLL